MAEAETRTVVVVGASYAGGWNPENPIAGYRIVARGVSGEQTFQTVARINRDVLELRPEAVIIWGFINDIFRSDPARIEQTLVGTRKNLLEMVDAARQANVVPILATEVTIRGEARWSELAALFIGRLLGKASYQDYINRYVSETNRWLRDTSAREQIPLLDFEAVLADAHGIRKKEFAKQDGSHISEQGYTALTHYTEERLATFSTIR
jgi:lysophospholipase L1-like esterase